MNIWNFLVGALLTVLPRRSKSRIEFRIERRWQAWQLNIVADTAYYQNFSLKVQVQKEQKEKKSIWEMKSKTATTDRLSRQNGTCQPVIEVTDVYIKIGEMVGNHCIRKRSYHCKTTQQTSVWSRHPVAEELEKGRFTYDIMRRSIPNTERGIQALWVCWPGGGGC